MAAKGNTANAEANFQVAEQLFAELEENHWAGATMYYKALLKFWIGEFPTAINLAKDAWQLVTNESCIGCSLSAKRIEGLAALSIGDLETASKCLHDTVQHSREIALVGEEIGAIIGLAGLHCRQTDFKAARELLDDVWDIAERGPYYPLHADAMNVLAQLERDAGNTAKAIEAATQAYRLAWCDGPPYAYHWGLEAARKHLRELGAPEPEMPPFDPSKFEPMPEVEINPKDEFYVEIEEEA